MRFKIVSIALAALFIIMVVPVSTHAGYVMAISGKSDFVATPYQPQMFNTSDVYVRVYLTEYSESSLEIEMRVEGELAPFVSFPDYTGIPTFTLFPGENEMIRYTLDFPISAPGRYSGSILAIGNPPTTEVDDGAGAIGKPTVAINFYVDVPSDVQIFDFITYRPGGYPDRGWLNWGNNWTTEFSIVNAAAELFNGYCNLTLSDSGGVIEYDRFNITNLSSTANISRTMYWQPGLSLNSDYEIRAVIYSDLGEKKEEEALALHIPSPADIIEVSHSPEVVLSENTVGVYATLASTDSTVNLNYQVNNGSTTTTPMTYSASSGEYSATIPTQAIGSLVFYWVTSTNGVFSDRSPASGAYNYFVFSPDVPDLTIDEDNFLFVPIDPRTQAMNETDITNVYIMVRNIGRGSATNIVVRVMDGEAQIWQGTIPSLAGDGGQTTVNFAWEPLEGQHILRFEVDPDDAIVELDENNNYFTLDAITIHEEPPYVPPEEPSSATNLIPYILIPIILVVLILLLLRRKKGIKVTISDVKPFKHPKDGTMRWKYTCTYGDGQVLGVTKSTDMNAEVGTTILVKPTAIFRDADDTLSWADAEVLKVLEDEEPDDVETIRKLAKKEK